MKNFFSRLKREKDLRFDLFIGIWSAIIILIILSAVIYAVIYFTGNASGDILPIETAAPVASEEPVSTVSPAPSSEPTTEPTERPSYENIDDDEEDYDNDNDDSSSSTSTVYATTNVNVRSQPDASSTSYGKLLKGESVERIEKMSNGWSKVKYNGRDAYIPKQAAPIPLQPHLPKSRQLNLRPHLRKRPRLSLRKKQKLQRNLHIR